MMMAKWPPRIGDPRIEPQRKKQLIEYELVDRCCRGERSAQHEIYVLTVERIYRLILRITGNQEDAFDLVQETYIRAFTRANQFDGRSSFETWLSRIAINQALQNKRRVALQDRTAASMNGRNMPSAAHATHDQTIDVEDALAQLSEADRAMLVLRYQEGLDYAAIADLTGCPPGTVASRLNRARGRVRELLKKSYAPPEESPRAVHPISRSNKGSAQPAADVPAPRLQRGAEP
ncbi:MAG: sigma-70 family RNA polymerase sigma factor [Planctomycetota bacterium]